MGFSYYILLVVFIHFFLTTTKSYVLNRDLFPDLHTVEDQKSVKDRYIVLLIDHLGLANRLRSLADWYVAAILSKRKLVVSWRHTIDCNATFTDLFEVWPDGLEFLEEPLSDHSFVWLQNAADARGLTYYTFDSADVSSNAFWAVNGSIWARKDIVFSKDIDAIFTNYMGLLTFDFMPCSVYKHLRSKFLRSLIPTVEVRSIVQSIYADYFENQLIVGVHIRVHDHLYDWPMVPFSGTSEAKKLGEGIPLSHYISVMQRIYVHFSDMDSKTEFNESTNETLMYLPERSRVRFFLISNDDDIKQEVMSNFPTGAVFSPKLPDYSRSSTFGIQCALIEFLLLARTQLVIQTFGSSFSQEAAAYSELPVASILPEGIAFRDSRSHQYCGDSLIARCHLVDDDSIEEGIVYEGTHDRRAVNVKYTLLHLCDDLKNWGIVQESFQLGIYCYERVQK